MAVELGGITLQHLTHVSVRERARIVHHAVPGMSGDLAQTLGRPSVKVVFHGIFYGENAADDLNQLRAAYLENEPVDFFTEAVGEGYFSQVLISKLEVSQRAGYLDQFNFVCEVVEYVEPSESAEANPLSSLDAELIGEAAASVDDVQNALDQASKLTDQIANFPSSFSEIQQRTGSVSDEAIRQIDELKGQLQSINSNALSDAERLAIKTAASVAEATDFLERVAVQERDRVRNAFSDMIAAIPF